MDAAHLERLRRFALVAGLLLLTYAVAGVSVEPHLSAYGLSVTVSHPELLPVALLAASIWGLLKFGYYGIMLASGPYRVRRDLLDKLNVELGDKPKPGSLVSGRRVWMYFGSRRFQTSPWQDDYDLIRRQALEIEALFPKFAGARVTTELLRDGGTDDDGNEYLIFALRVMIPVRCRVAGLFQDFDYALPVLLNAAALGIYAWRAGSPVM